MNTIASFYKPYMRNDLHVQFHHMACTIIGQSAAQVGVPEQQLKDYQALVEREQQYVNRTLGSTITAQLQAADARRDNLLRYVLLRLQAVCLGTNERDLEAAPILRKHILDKYPPSIASLANKEASAQIRGLVADLMEASVARYVAAAGLTDTVGLLALQNDTYDELYMQRTIERADRPLDEMLRTRLQADATFDQIVLAVQGLANAYDTSAATYAPALTLIGRLNPLIADFRTRVKQYAAAQEGASGDDGASADDGASGGTDGPALADAPAPADGAAADGDAAPGTSRLLEADPVTVTVTPSAKVDVAP